MSFGFSIGDLATLISLTKKTYDSWSQAPKEYAEVVRTLSESKTLLCHVERRFDMLTGAGAGNDVDVQKQKEIASLLKGCQSAISELRTVVKRRRKLGHWDRIRLGSSGHVHECRARLARHINILTPFLFSLELESIGKDVSCLPASILDRLPQVVAHALPAALGKMIDDRIEDSRTARGSVMTTYGEEDDKMAYRELRRNLRFFGIKDEVVRQQRKKLVEFVKTLTQDDYNSTASEADDEHQVLEEEVVSVPSPPLFPYVEDVDSAEEVELAFEILAGTIKRRQYQAYVETEDEDDPTESTVAEPSNDNTARRPANAEESEWHSSKAHMVKKAESGAKDTLDTTQNADTTSDLGKSTSAPKGRRKYQAYAETEDEEDIPETSSTLLSDSSVPEDSNIYSPKSQPDPVPGAKEHPPSSSESDDVTPPPTPHLDANHKPNPRRNTQASPPSKAPDRPTPQTKPGRSPRRTRSRAFAVCGDLEYQKCLDSSSSESEDSKSVATHGSHETRCSSCDQQLTSGDEDSWRQLSSDGSQCSDSEQQHSEVDDDASKIAHSGDTDGEEVSSTKATQRFSARRPDNSQKRTKRNAEPSTPLSPPSSDLKTSPPPPNRPQRLLEYTPLLATSEEPLTIQLHMPPGYTLHVENGRIAQFHNPCVPNTRRQYFSTLPPPSKEYRYHPFCRHGFPSPPQLPGRMAWCGCEGFRWTEELEGWNPGFVDGLREWVLG